MKKKLLALGLALVTTGCSQVAGFAGAKALGFDNQEQPDHRFGFATFGPEMRSQTRGPVFRWGFYDYDGTEIRYDQIVDTTWELRHGGRLLGRWIKEETISQTVSAGPGLDYEQQGFKHVQRERTNPPSSELPVYRDDLEDGTYTVNRIIRADSENGGNRTFSATFEIQNGEFVPFEGDKPTGRVDGQHFYPFPKVSG